MSDAISTSDEELTVAYHALDALRERIHELHAEIDSLYDQELSRIEADDFNYEANNAKIADLARQLACAREQIPVSLAMIDKLEGCAPSTAYDDFDEDALPTTRVIPFSKRQH